MAEELPSAGSPVVHVILRLELALARRDAAAVPDGLASLIDPAFVELGSGGCVWDAASTLASLDRPSDDEIAIEEFALHPLSEAAVLVTYRMTEVPLEGVPRRRLRSSIWIRRGDRWVMRFHQGTPIA